MPVTSFSPTTQLALEQAHEAVITLKTVKPLLSLQDRETLALLMDKELMSNLERSVQEAENGKLEPLENILD